LVQNTFLATYAAEAEKAMAMGSEKVCTHIHSCCSTCSILHRMEAVTVIWATLATFLNLVLSKIHKLDEYLHLPIENVKELLKW
jgi:Zn-finger protein